MLYCRVSVFGIREENDAGPTEFLNQEVIPSIETGSQDTVRAICVTCGAQILPFIVLWAVHALDVLFDPF